MSNRLYNLVRNTPIETTAKFVALEIAYCVNEQKGEIIAYPTIEKLAKNTSLSTRTIERQIVKLEREGFLIVKRRDHKGDYRGAKWKNAYEINEAKCQETIDAAKQSKQRQVKNRVALDEPLPDTLTGKPTSECRLNLSSVSPILPDTLTGKQMSSVSPKLSEQSLSTIAFVENANLEKSTSENPPIYNSDCNYRESSYVTSSLTDEAVVETNKKELKSENLESVCRTTFSNSSQDAPLEFLVKIYASLERFCKQELTGSEKKEIQVLIDKCLGKQVTQEMIKERVDDLVNGKLDASIELRKLFDYSDIIPI
jgi:DNA-binding transcriptional regulator YhcF (GntR family)